MAKWDTRVNLPPVRRNSNLERMGGKATVCERILTTYIETGRSIRSLAAFYGCSKSTIGRYIKDYAEDCAPYSLYEQGRDVAQRHLGKDGANDTDEWGSYD